MVNDFLLYGKYNAENTEKIVLTINSLQNRTSRLKGLFLDIKNDWPSYYLPAGIGYFIFSYKFQLYLHEFSERHNRLYETLLNILHNVLKGIATLSKGYLPVEIFSPSKLRQISETALTFPIFVQNFNKMPLTLYEIETVNVPIDDQNYQADSYSEVKITKSYIAINKDYNVQLRIKELRMQTN